MSVATKAKFLKATHTTSLQSQTETECKSFFVSIPELPPALKNDLIRLSLIDPQTCKVLVLREKHIEYLNRPLFDKNERMLPKGYMGLDASKPWIIYWTLHALDLLDSLPSEDTLKGIVHTLESCWSNAGLGGGGGFGGGVGQMPHCATSYAAVMALCIVAGCDENEYPEATKMALELLIRKRLEMLRWYVTLRYERMDESSNKLICGYRMHHDGEVDVRATYCVCAVASLLDILTDDLTSGMSNHVVSCQTYEGGFGGEPGLEAHGGYTFCALGALHILAKGSGVSSICDLGVDMDNLQDWLIKRQMSFEGGFSGRTNKLVDGCYSFWVGAAIALIDLDCHPTATPSKFDSGVYDSTMDPIAVTRSMHDCVQVDQSPNHNNQAPTCTTTKLAENLTFDEDLLQRYILLCAQDPYGGLRDKPSKGKDFYHSCYNLSGLSVSQHVLSKGHHVEDKRSRKNDHEPCEEEEDDTTTKTTYQCLYQSEQRNLLGATHPVYNIRVERIQSIVKSFKSI